MAFSKNVSEKLRAALHEDIGRGDITSNCLIPGDAAGHAILLAKESGIFCGIPVVRELLRHDDPRIRAQFFIRDGEAFHRGQDVIELKGSVRSILKLERTLVNFLAWLCGIATVTNAYVRAVSGHGVKVLDTRKTTPLWRELEKYAVKIGGGVNHRMGLYDAMLVKENHRPFGDLKKLCRFKNRFVIEVRDFKELREAVDWHPRSILFDNFSPGLLKKAVCWVRSRAPRIVLEASGGITLKNAAKYAASGVDQISVGSITHSVKALDFSLLIKHLPALPADRPARLRPSRQEAGGRPLR
jgi:nicotinate-nucleotide pyrophosphorylase (carboxylating)